MADRTYGVPNSFMRSADEMVRRLLPHVAQTGLLSCHPLTYLHAFLQPQMSNPYDVPKLCKDILRPLHASLLKVHFIAASLAMQHTRVSWIEDGKPAFDSRPLKRLQDRVRNLPAVTPEFVERSTHTIDDLVLAVTSAGNEAEKIVDPLKAALVDAGRFDSSRLAQFVDNMQVSGQICFAAYCIVYLLPTKSNQTRLGHTTLQAGIHAVIRLPPTLSVRSYWPCLTTRLFPKSGPSFVDSVGWVGGVVKQT